VVNLGSNAVANTLPAGGALAMGVSWAMLSSWGVSTADYVLYTLVSGIWNVFARLGLPVLALLLLATVGRPGDGLIAAAAAGLVLIAVPAVGLGLLVRSESFEALLYALVFIYKGGEVVKSSKRAGNFVTCEEVAEEIDEAAGTKGAGRDALRFFFLSRSANSTVEFITG